MDDAPRSGMPQALLASSAEAIRLLKGGVEHGDKFSQPLEMLQQRVGPTVSVETTRRYQNTYLSRQIRPRKRLKLTIKHMRARLCFTK
jgi:hypothetical protein